MSDHQDRVSLLERPEAVPTLPDEQLEWELTVAAAARTTSRQRLFDLLLEELQRRRTAYAE